MVANSKPMRSLVSKTADRSPIALGSSASHRAGTLKAQSSNPDLTRTGRPVARGLNENTASSSQVWHSDVNYEHQLRGDPWRKRQRNPLVQTYLTTTYRYPGKMLAILRMSTQMYDKNWVVNRETICLRSTSTR